MGQHEAPRAVFDVQGTLHRLGGDEELLTDLIGIFLEDMPPLLAELQKSAEGQDATSAKKAAHALKGLVLGCGGDRAGHVAQQVEDAAAAEDLSRLASHVAALKKEIEFLVEAICCYRT